jgi:hypothetical protein
VFEHLKPDDIAGVLEMLRRVSCPHALFSHQVDVRDHRSSEGLWMDRRLSYLDFLTLPSETWRFWNDNLIAYTNRWRKSDYVRALQAQGFEVAASRDTVWEGAMLPIPLAALHPDFQHYAEADLRVMAFLVYGRVVH